jgi:hypothetical protein
MSNEDFYFLSKKITVEDSDSGKKFYMVRGDGSRAEVTPDNLQEIGLEPDELSIGDNDLTYLYIVFGIVLPDDELGVLTIDKYDDRKFFSTLINQTLKPLPFEILAIINSATGPVQLPGVDLSRCKISGIKLPGANLSGANLSGSDLSRADLTSADLQSTNLTKANLRDARLKRADLKGADLVEADLSGANLEGAKYTVDTTWPDGFDPEKVGDILVDNDEDSPRTYISDIPNVQKLEGD